MTEETESLKDKLFSLGVRLGKAKDMPAPGKIYSIESVLPDGFDVETPFGPTFSIEKQLSPEYLQGNTLLESSIDAGRMQRWANLPAAVNLNKQDFLFLDTETSGLAGGTGTIPFMIGLGFFSDHSFKVLQLFMRTPAEEEALLHYLNHIIHPFSAIVTFNGKSFDIPLLNTRHILKGLTPPFQSKFHFDLLHLSRRIWRHRLNDRSLSSLENEILNFKRSEEEIPGWMVPQIYFDYLKERDARPLRGVFYHNSMDIVSLAALFIKINTMLQEPNHGNLTNNLDRLGLAQVFEKIGLMDQALQEYKTSISHGLPDEFEIKSLMKCADIYRRNGLEEEASELWKKVAELKQPDACIELSKYYEHHLRDYHQAKQWAEEGLRLAKENNQPRWSHQKEKSDLLHRLERINILISREEKNAD